MAERKGTTRFDKCISVSWPLKGQQLNGGTISALPLDSPQGVNTPCMICAPLKTFDKKELRRTILEGLFQIDKYLLSDDTVEAVKVILMPER